ncbi:hypothetical protein PV326_010175 [Microctonus aethiopoides]|nr:hypothetical protein PV326_010175 [Microctonus aethiopoides]
MPEFNEDSLPVKNLKSILQQSFENEIEIDKAEWKYLTDPGENFGSLIFAIDVTLICDSKTKLLHVVAKLPPPSSYLLKLFNSPCTFSKELAFYKELTPEFLQLQRENGILDPEFSWLGPHYIGGRMSLNDNETFDNQASIVLENLNSSGYKMADRLIGLNKSQTEFAVKQLAKFHAIGIAMREKKPKLFMKVVTPALVHVANETAEQCVMDMIEKSIEDLSKIDEAKPYMNVVKKSIEIAGKTEIHKTKSDEMWCTLVHNDFWVNNMMFKFNESNDVIDMKIVDFQLCAYDFGVKDLIFFLISSPMNEIIDDIFDDMVDVYYNSFISALDVFKINVADYKKDHLLTLLEKCAPLKFAQCLMMAQVIKSQPGSAPDIETIDNKESFLQIGGGKAHYDKLLQILNVFRKRGWIINSQK